MLAAPAVLCLLASAAPASTLASTLAGPLQQEAAEAPPPAAEDGIAVKEADRRVELRNEAFRRLRREAMPEPATPEELASWAAETGFSGEGLALLPAIEANYRRAWSRVGENSGAEILSRIESSYRFDERLERIVVVPTPELVDLLVARLRFASEVETVEAALFREYETLADPSARRLLEDIRHERAQRVNLRAERLPGSTLDLVDLFARESIDASAHLGVPEALDRYRRDHASLLRTRHREGLALELDRATRLVELGPAWELVLPEEEVVEMREALQNAERRSIELDAPLRVLNRETITALRRMLPDEEGQRLQRAYQSLTYPEHFRDEDRFVSLLATPPVSAALLGDRADAAMLSLDRATREVQRPALLLMELADSLAVVETLPDPLTRAEASMLLESRILELGQARRDRFAIAAEEVLNTLPADAPSAVEAVRAHLQADQSLRRATVFRRAQLADQVERLRGRVVEEETAPPSP